MYGLDINPRAVKMSWINLYLNALDDKGQPIYDGEKKTLLDRVEFHESDLLSYCRDNDIQLERIVGCIPQVLSTITIKSVRVGQILCLNRLQDIILDRLLCQLVFLKIHVMQIIILNQFFLCCSCRFLTQIQMQCLR